MSLKSSQVLDRSNLNRSFLSKSATGTQIFQGSLRMLGSLDMGGQTIKTTGTIYAGTFSGSFSGNGASITSINASNISSGTIDDARLGSTVMQTDVAQTITANKTMNATLYFANGTTYYVDTAGSAKVNTLTVASNSSVAGTLSVTGDITAGATAKFSGATGTVLLKHAVSEANAWVFQENAPNWGLYYFNNGSATDITFGDYTTVGAEFFGAKNGSTTNAIKINNTGWDGTDTNTYATWMLSNAHGRLWTAGNIQTMDTLVGEHLEIRNEIKHSVYNEFTDPVLASLGVGRWGGVRGTWTFDSAQKPTGTKANGSIKVVPTNTDAYAYWGEYFDVTPGEWITFSCYVFSTVSGRASQLYIQWSDSAKATLVSGGHVANDISNTATSWTRYSLTAQAPSGARYFRVRIDNDGYDATTNATMFFSAFQIERGRAMSIFKPGNSNLEMSDDGTYSRLSRSGEQILAYWNDNTKLKLGGRSGNITTFTDGPFGVKMEPADGTTVDINGQSGSSGYQNFRVRYQVGGTQGGLANTELSGLAHRTYGGITNWAALYAKAGSAHWAGLFEGLVSINGKLAVGSDSATYDLDVIGSSTGGVNARIYNTHATATDSYAALRLGTAAHATSQLVLFSNSSNRTADGGASNSTIRTDTGKLHLSANGGQKMTIDTNGNIGIGIQSPLAKLHISNSANAPASTAISGASGLVVDGVDGNIDLMSYDDNTDVSHSIGFGRYKNDSTGAIIDKAGIVVRANTSTAAGANTINRIAFTFGASKDPWNNTEVFSVNRNGNMTVGNITSSNITSSGVIKSTNTTGFEYTGASSNNTDGTGNAAIRANDYSQWIWNTATTWGLFWAGNSGAAYSAGGTIARASTNPDEFVFVGGGVVLLSIGGAAGNTYIKGNLGLGTASPAEKLDVEGNARVNGAVKVKDRFSFEYNSSQDALEIKVI